SCSGLQWLPLRLGPVRSSASALPIYRGPAMKTFLATMLLIGCSLVLACHGTARQTERQPLVWSGWIEEAAAQRGHVEPGDVAQFGCPPGWYAVEDTAAALRGRDVSTVYMGTDPPPREATITCVAQKEF